MTVTTAPAPQALDFTGIETRTEHGRTYVEYPHYPLETPFGTLRMSPQGARVVAVFGTLSIHNVLYEYGANVGRNEYLGDAWTVQTGSWGLRRANRPLGASEYPTHKAHQAVDAKIKPLLLAWPDAHPAEMALGERCRVLSSILHLQGEIDEEAKKRREIERKIDTRTRIISAWRGDGRLFSVYSRWGHYDNWRYEDSYRTLEDAAYRLEETDRRVRESTSLRKLQLAVFENEPYQDPRESIRARGSEDSEEPKPLLKYGAPDEALARY